MKQIAIRYKGMSFHHRTGMPLRPGNEKHSYLEIIYLISGSANFIVNGTEQKIDGGTMIIIPDGCFHQFITENVKTTKFLVVNVRSYNDERIKLLQGMDKVHIINDKKSPYIKTLAEIARVLTKEYDSLEVRVWLYSAVMALFSSMKRRGEILKSEPIKETHSNLVSDAVKHIEQNMTCNLTIENIAAELLVSPSTLSHSFKKEMGISIYKYLLQRRTMYAYELLEKGYRPTEVSDKCGFNDYSSFYRIYRHAYGIPPSMQKEPKGKTKIVKNINGRKKND